MTGERHLNGSDRILLSGVQNSITALTAEELSSLRRVLNMNIRIAPVDFDRSEAVKVLRQNVAGASDEKESVESLIAQMTEYLERSLVRLEGGLRTWLGVQVNLQLRSLREEALSGKAAS